MDQPLYDIYFTGQLIEGTDQETAQANLAKLFKADPANVARYFTGKAVPLKRGVDKTAALKYKAALHKAGMMVAFKAHQADSAEPASKPAPPAATQAAAASPAPTAPKPTPQTSGDSIPQTAQPVAESPGSFSLAAAGSDLLTESERDHTDPREVDTSNIKMVSAFMQPEPENKEEPPAPDTSHISVAGAGADLLVDKPEPPPPLPLNLDDITLAPAGTELEQIKDELPPLDPDTSAISMAEVGADILPDKNTEPAPTAPSTDHIQLSEND